jgi:hypothetical protein
MSPLALAATVEVPGGVAHPASRRLSAEAPTPPPPLSVFTREAAQAMVRMVDSLLAHPVRRITLL